MILGIEFVRTAYKTAQFRQPPTTHSLVKRIVEDKVSPTVVDKLDKATIHHFFAHGNICQQRNLVGIEHTHCLGCKFSTDSLIGGIHYYLHKLIHAFAGSFGQSGVFDFYYHNDAKLDKKNGKRICKVQENSVCP